MIHIDNLIKKFGKFTAVDIPALEIQRGEIIGLVGNNGAGKTTLLRLMLDLYKADKGNVCICGKDVSKSEDWKSFTGSFIDNSFLIDFLSPEEYFHFIGDCYGLTKQDVTARLSAYERFMNGELLKKGKLIKSLSAGNRQKVGILAAMISNPALLILDEPFNFLDPSSQIELVRILQGLNTEHETTMVLSSHNLDNLGECSSRILLMEKGRLISDLKNGDEDALAQVKDYFAER